MNEQRPFPITNDSHFYINIDEGGLRTFGGTESECQCVLTVLGSGKVVTRDELATNLRESGLEVVEIDSAYWPMRKEL